MHYMLFKRRQRLRNWVIRDLTFRRCHGEAVGKTFFLRIWYRGAKLKRPSMVAIRRSLGSQYRSWAAVTRMRKRCWVSGRARGVVRKVEFSRPFFKA